MGTRSKRNRNGPNKGSPKTNKQVQISSEERWISTLFAYRGFFAAFVAVIIASSLFVANQKYDFHYMKSVFSSSGGRGTCPAPSPSGGQGTCPAPTTKRTPIDMLQLERDLKQARGEIDRGMTIVEKYLMALDLLSEGEMDEDKSKHMLEEAIEILSKAKDGEGRLYSRTPMQVVREVPRNFEYRRKFAYNFYYLGLTKRSLAREEDAAKLLYMGYRHFNDLFKEMYDDGDIEEAIELGRDMALVALDTCRAFLHVPDGAWATGETASWPRPRDLANGMFERYAHLQFFIHRYSSISNKDFTPETVKPLGEEILNDMDLELADAPVTVQGTLLVDRKYEGETWEEARYGEMTVEDAVDKYADMYEDGNEKGISLSEKLRLASILMCAAYYEVTIALFKNSAESFSLAMEFYDDYINKTDAVVNHLGVEGGLPFPREVVQFFKNKPQESLKLMVERRRLAERRKPADDEADIEEIRRLAEKRRTTNLEFLQN